MREFTQKFFPFFLLLLPALLSAQTLESKKDSLLFFGDVLTNANLDINKRVAADHFQDLFKSLLEAEDNPIEIIDQVPIVSVQIPPDSTFAIFTWQLILEDGADFQYFGYIYSLDGQFSPVELQDNMSSRRVTEYSTVGSDYWASAHYYNIKAFEMPDGRIAYLLFGINGYSKFNRLRVMDVLHRENGNFYFGAPVFGEDTSTIARTGKSRIILEYTYDAPLYLNFDEEYELVVMNHLDRMEGMHPGQGMTGIPSGDYIGYRYENGFWVYVPEVVRERSIPEQTAPQNPRKDRQKRDLFGRPIDR